MQGIRNRPEYKKKKHPHTNTKQKVAGKVALQGPGELGERGRQLVLLPLDCSHIVNEFTFMGYLVNTSVSYCILSVD